MAPDEALDEATLLLARNMLIEVCKVTAADWGAQEMAERVALVEDDEDVRELLRLILASAGFQVLPLAHPRLLQAFNPDQAPALFLIDLMLPGMSGVEVARQLRARGFTTPIVGISASRLRLEIAAGSGLFDATICKPFDMQELIDCVHTAMAAHAVAAGCSAVPEYRPRAVPSSD